MIQDIFPHKLYNSYDAAAEPTPDSYVLSFHQAQVLLKQDDSLPQVSDMGQSDYRFLFRIDDHSYFLPNEHFQKRKTLLITASVQCVETKTFRNTSAMQF